MSPRVLFLVHSLARAGTEQNVALTCKYFDQQRFRPEVWVRATGQPLEKIVREAGVEICTLEHGHKFSPWGTLKAARQIAGSKFDLLHIYLPSVAVYAALAKLVFGLRQPMIFRCGWCHDLVFGARWRYKWLYRRAFTAFVANSPSSAAFLESMGIDRAKIRIIPNIHEEEVFQRPVDRHQVRESLGIAPDAPLLIHVGRLTPSKRVGDLIEAVGLLAPSHPNLRVLLVGDGNERAQIEHRIGELNLTRQISLLGVRDDIPALLKSSDLFVFPSEIEGSPNAVIEACFAELPIVACDVPGVRDVVQHRTTALLAPPHDPRRFADCIEESLNDLPAARQRAIAARSQAESVYRVENVLSQLYELYDELLAVKSTDAPRKPAATTA
jgi:glycosyltransferase involved in cell wall biosynthesis